MSSIINKIKNTYLLYPLFELIQNININLNKSKEKILIYQMGKVGSSTIHQTIKKLKLTSKIYHIHWLSKKGINESENYFKSSVTGKVPMHLRRSKALKKIIDFKKDKIKIISITREPVGRIISDLFQNMEFFNPKLIDNNDLIFKSLIERLDHCDVSSDFTSNWFDSEFKKALNIDIYNYNFDSKKGYSIIKINNIEILLLQMEAINNVLPIALSEFLNYSDTIEVINANVGESKEYSKLQKYVKENIKLNIKVLNNIYESKYFKHFYNKNQKQEFIDRWLS